MSQTILHEETWAHESGLTCRIVKNGWPKELRDKVISATLATDWWCGYVTVPLGCPHFDDYSVDVHGGITYQAHGEVGFDCNHSGDIGQWDREKVMAETESLAQEIANIAGPVVMLAHGTREVVRG